MQSAIWNAILCQVNSCSNFILQLSTTGGRIIMSSDGVWDALSAETAYDCCRGMSVETAAAQIVKVWTVKN